MNVASAAAPPSLLDKPAEPPRIDLAPGRLTIHADNSSLADILHRLTSDSGMTVDGLGGDQRIFGSYGPGDPQEVLSTLLDGSGYNVVMVGRTETGTPRQISLTPRGAGLPSSGPSRPQQIAQDEDNDDEAQQPIEPPGAPQPPQEHPSSRTTACALRSKCSRRCSRCASNSSCSSNSSCNQLLLSNSKALRADTQPAGRSSLRALVVIRGEFKSGSKTLGRWIGRLAPHTLSVFSSEERVWARSRYLLFAATTAVAAGRIPTAGDDCRSLGCQRNKEDCRKREYECFGFHKDQLL